MTTPNTIIAGMPRCGTTSLFEYLAAHPQVCASKVKETYFLMDTTSPLFKPTANLNIHGESGYAVFFPDCGKEPIRLESTPDYFYQATAFDYLALKRPRPKLIFILREPASRIYSLFRFAQNNILILPKNMRFAQFLDHVRKGNFTQRPILANALEQSRYCNHLSKWAMGMGKNNMHVLTLEALQNRPNETMHAIAAYLGIVPDFFANYRFKIQNQSITIRWPILQRIKRHFSSSLRSNKWRSKMGKIYRKINNQPLGPDHLEEDRQVLNQLKLEFAIDNQQLKEYGLDASTIWNNIYQPLSPKPERDGAVE